MKSRSLTPAQVRVKILLLQKGQTLADLSRLTGLTGVTIYNTLSGRTAGRKSRQAITNATGTPEIWPGILPNRRK